MNTNYAKSSLLLGVLAVGHLVIGHLTNDLTTFLVFYAGVSLSVPTYLWGSTKSRLVKLESGDYVDPNGVVGVVKTTEGNVRVMLSHAAYFEPVLELDKVAEQITN